MPEALSLEINPFHVDDPLRVVTAAVTPVVMISASAILISGISSKHQSLSDRVRTLAAEFRNANATPERKDNIYRQIRYFRRRLRYVAIAHMSLYLATACFIFMVMVISFTVKISTLVAWTLPLLLVGVALLLLAVTYEIRELRMSRDTMRLELTDIEVSEE